MNDPQDDDSGPRLPAGGRKAQVLDAVMAREWLTILHGRSPGLIGISAAGDQKFVSAAFENIDDAVRHIEHLDRAGKQGIYCRVTTLRTHPPQGQRGNAELSLAFTGLWCDLDIAGPGHKTTEPLPPDEDAARSIVTAAGLPEPTRWIHSGGGLYGWWLLPDPHIIGDDRANLEDLSSRWQEALVRGAASLGYHYGNVGDLPRVLRIPGTVNRKAGLERPCVILPDVGPTYSLNELRKTAQELVLPEPTPTPPAPISGNDGFWDSQHSGPGPFDAFAEVASWTDLLAPHGWEYVGGERDGGELWKRPGGTSAYSARCGHNGVPVMVVHSTDAGLPAGAGQHLTKGRVFAHLNYGGDAAAAARDLRAAAAGDPTAGRARALPRGVLHHVAQRCSIPTWTPQPPPPLPAGPTDHEHNGQDPEAAPAALDPPRHDPNRLVIRSLADVAADVDARPPRPWLFEPVWAAGDYGVMSAQDKAGKTWAILDAAISCAAGDAWLNQYPCRAPGPVLVFLGEGSDAKMIRRMRAIGAHKGLTREQVDALPILLCFRAPQLSQEAHLGIISATLEEHRPALLIIDPLYLAAGGANGADLYAMGALLGNIQHVAQSYGAALLLSHHWNKTGEGSGHSRSSGVGPGAWGRVLISIAVTNSRTDDATQETTVWLKWSFKGDEIPETDTSLVRRVRADNSADLTSPLHYSIEAEADPSGDEPGKKRPPAQAKILEALETLSGAPASAISIGDAIAKKHGTGLRRETMSRHLNALHKEGVVDRDDLGEFIGTVWSLKSDKTVDTGVTNGSVTPPVTKVDGHTRSQPPADHTIPAGQPPSSRVTEPEITPDHTDPCDVTASYIGGHTGHTGVQSQQSQPSSQDQDCSWCGQPMGATTPGQTAHPECGGDQPPPDKLPCDRCGKPTDPPPPDQSVGLFLCPDCKQQRDRGVNVPGTCVRCGQDRPIRPSDGLCLRCQRPLPSSGIPGVYPAGERPPEWGPVE